MENWFQELENYLDKVPDRLSIGSIVSGKVIKITEDYVFVDIGLKSEAIIPLHEVKTEEGLLIKEGSEIKALIVGKLKEYEAFILSFRKLKEKELWEEIKEHFKKNQSIEVKVVSEIKGGYKVKYKELIEGFLPYSQSYFRDKPKSSQELIGKFLKVDILKLRDKNLVVSRRKYLEKEYKKKKEDLLKKIKEEGVLEGAVKKIINGGYLISFDDVLIGYLPFKELAWQKLDNPEECLKKGDRIKVKVIYFDPVKEKLKVSLKALTPDPWEQVEEKYQEGQKVRGKITKIFNFGAFLEIEPGIEGLIPRSEITWNQKIDIKEVLKEGDIVEALILDLKPSEKKIVFSLRKLEPSPWEKLASKIKPGDVISGKIKDITNFGIFVEVEEGIDGFIHISNLSWQRIENPEDFYKKGKEIRTKVLEIDPQKRRLQLSIKHLEPDPWVDFFKSHKTGDIVEGTIKKVIPSGLIVELSPGVQALMPLKELIENVNLKKISIKSDKILSDYKEGNKIKGKIILMDLEKRRILLSYREYLRDLEKEEIKTYKLSQSTGSITLGDFLSQKLKIRW